jgi:biofilm PGA synthesis lipoprotein PgaB
MLPHSPLRRSLLVRMAALGPVLFLGACARPAVTRSSVPLLPRSAPPWPSRHVLVLAYHDVEDTDPDPRFMSVRTDHLVEHFSWLRENGYEPVSVARLVQAQQGTVPLPAKPVLLTFDDGYASFLTRVLPLLKAFHWPAVLAPVGQWTDNPLADTVNFGGQAVPRSRFLTWPMARHTSHTPQWSGGNCRPHQ